MPQGRVIVAHPGAASSIWELAAAVDRLGWDLDYHCGWLHHPGDPVGRALSALPAVGRSLARELGRRAFAGLDPARTTQHRLIELAYVLTARAFRTRPRWPAAVMHWRNRRFDGAVAAAIRRARPAAVIGHDTSAIATIRAARAVGAPSLLNQLIGHVAVGDRILAEEARAWPDWADSMHAGAPDWLVEQCLAEAREADVVLAPSDYVRDTLVEVGVAPARVRLLPFGVRLDRFHPPERPRDDGVFRVLYVGQISQRKGLAYALEAIRRLGRQDVEFLLVGGVVGAGRGLARHEGWFRHVPNVPFSEVAELYRSADVLLYPSLHEGSALAILEAMASGLPVVTTLNSGSFVRDGIDGLFVPTRDPPAIAAALEKLRDDPDARARMAASARARALEFSWERYQTDLGRILHDVTGSAPAGA